MRSSKYKINRFNFWPISILAFLGLIFFLVLSARIFLMAGSWKIIDLKEKNINYLKEEENSAEKVKKQLKYCNKKILAMEEVLSLVHSEAELDQKNKEKNEREINKLKLKYSKTTEKLQRSLQELKKKEAILSKKEVQEVLGFIVDTKLSKQARPIEQFRTELFSRLHRVFYLKRGFLLQGNRFIIESKNIFLKDTAILSFQGKKYLGIYVEILKDIISHIPKTCAWVLYIQSHTDARVFNNKKYFSNLHLSSHRAAVVMNFLVSKGLPGNKLISGGVGSYQLLKKEKSMTAHRRNNRLELILDQR